MNEAKFRIEVTSDTYFEFHILLKIVIFQLKFLFVCFYFIFQELEAEGAEKTRLQSEVETLTQKLKDEQVNLPSFLNKT
jgi:hypothetical protein